MKIKQAKSDFTSSQLPHNRREVFFDCIKQRWRLLFCIGLLLLAFVLPTLIVDCVADVYGMFATSQFQNGQISEKQAFAAVIVTKKISKLCHVVTFAVFALGLSGLTRVIRQLLWGEGVFFKADFSTGVKQNGLIYSLFGVVCGLVDFCCYIVRMSKMQVVWQVLPQVISLVLLLPIVAFILSYETVYADSVWKTTKNSFLLYFKMVPQTLVALIVAMSPCFLVLISNILLKYLLLIVVILLFSPLCLMEWQLYCYGVFDKYINAYAYPEILNKGIETEV